MDKPRELLTDILRLNNSSLFIKTCNLLLDYIPNIPDIIISIIDNNELINTFIDICSDTDSYNISCGIIEYNQLITIATKHFDNLIPININRLLTNIGIYTNNDAMHIGMTEFIKHITIDHIICHIHKYNGLDGGSHNKYINHEFIAYIIKENMLTEVIYNNYISTFLLNEPRILVLLYNNRIGSNKFLKSICLTAINFVCFRVNFCSSHDIQYLALANNKILYKPSNAVIAIKLFTMYDYLISINKFAESLYCELVRLFTYILQYERFHDIFYMTLSIGFVRNYYQYKFDYTLGFIMGMKENREQELRRCANNIIEAITDGTKPVNDSLYINIPVKFLNKLPYDVLLKTHKYISLIASVDKGKYDNTLYNLQYLLNNTECNVCCETTTNIFVPDPSKSNIHKCTFIYCKPCKAKVGNICGVCRKLFE